MKIFLSLFISCVAYSVLNHHLLNISYAGLNIVESAVRSFAIYSSMFLIYSFLPILISVLVAKIPKENRKKPYFPYFKVALIVTCILALVGLYFGWYAAQAISS